ncbi:hypothetical protein [Streptomyces sp. NRRL S-350]|nr:hypothetical protein [Streptomyces sp. NRRL S-350]
MGKADVVKADVVKADVVKADVGTVGKSADSAPDVCCGTTA